LFQVGAVADGFLHAGPRGLPVDGGLRGEAETASDRAASDHRGVADLVPLRTVVSERLVDAGQARLCLAGLRAGPAEGLLVGVDGARALLEPGDGLTGVDLENGLDVLRHGCPPRRRSGVERWDMDRVVHRVRDALV